MLRLFVLAFLFAGCTPRLAPLYTDFAAPEAVSAADSTTAARLARALGQAGWTLTEAPAPALATTPRASSDWGLYRVFLALEVIPLGHDHVRVLFNPYRRYLTGGRGKISYLPAGVRAKFVPPLVEALEAEGFRAVVSGERAYRQARDGT